ncbi:type IV pilus twitching motility protein PilT [Undibacterium arcticum]|uniref:type IV pilus twitching motility protein PilT n=1 Tax=Undibacterium arcticum TaxID=1762892 RepID=UPI00360C8080
MHQDAQKFAQLRHGLVLIIGDTSQGKSTTLASILDEINRTRSGHIVTVEDPVELLIPSRKCMITQREVGPDADVESFYHGTRDSLRQRPEVVMIGEIRDMETALEAVALAESGPLVFATLHAKSTEFGLMKMLRLLGDTENQAQALAQTLRGTICQALIPSLNGEAWHLASEVMTVNHDLARMIEQRNLSRIRPMMDSMAHQGCHLMNTDLLALYDNGQIRFEDARRATTDLPKFSAQFKPRN